MERTFLGTGFLVIPVDTDRSPPVNTYEFAVTAQFCLADNTECKDFPARVPKSITQGQDGESLTIIPVAQRPEYVAQSLRD